MKKIDLHMHTTISDGTDSLEELITHIRQSGIELFSVTDHDSIDGGDLMPRLLTDQEDAPAFIRGVEFSCRDEYGKYHILGYGYDPQIPGIGEVVRLGHSFRMKKTRERLAFLQEEFGFAFSQDEIDGVLNMDNPGKPHIARLMISHGYARDIHEAISEYINKKRFKGMHVRPEEAIEGIRKSGGIPVLAHPVYGDGDQLIMDEELEGRIEYLIGFGLQGVEAYYSGFTLRMQEQVLQIAAEHGLYVTAGSDYHGTSKMVKLGDTNLEDIAEAPEGLHRFLEDVQILG